METSGNVLQYKNELSKIRRDLHKIPELSFSEQKTSAYIFEYLERLSPDSLVKLAQTGVKAVFSVKNAKKTIAIRADMDALPITEKSDADYCSLHAGKMHACGHDGHVAMALVTARIVSGLKNNLENNYVFLFQPAEEGLGGAKMMIAEGALQSPDVDEIYGLHIWPYLPLGKIGTKEGPLMALMREANIHITGKASHGATPEHGTDALVAAAEFILAAQTIVSRNIPPHKRTVLTFGKIDAGTARNIICDNARLFGMMRTFDMETADFISRRILEILSGIDSMFGTKSTLSSPIEFPPVINDPALAKRAIEKLADVIEPVQPVMLSEDFSEYQRVVPGLFAFLGTATGNGIAPLHSVDFDFDETALLYGVEYYTRVCGIG